MPIQKNSAAPIAIVGVSALFPGSHDATGFWRDILAGRDLLTDVPNSHWRIEDYFDPDPNAPDKTYAKRGGFLSPIDFDALGWGIPPATLPATDTAQLLALVVAQSVLMDAAGDHFAAMDRSRISVILGVTSAQELLFSMVSRLQRPVWVKALRETGLAEADVQAACDRIAAQYVPWQEASFPGLLGNVVAGRIANRLNLGGTNCVTDAACASTFSALSMAANELLLGHSDLVIAGGVDTLNDIFMYMCFSKTPALSPTGDCRPFSDQADGTMLGEGLGMVACKRLADAERDGDRIYALIRGIGTSSDGRAKSVYAPVAAGQAQALRRAYESAGYLPSTVELMEAHGTGTKAGDAAEFEGLRTVFSEANGAQNGATQWCALGSVKSQIGHTKAAAGAAGLFKAIMALHHKILPPTIKITAPNPKLNIEQSPFYLNTETRPWIRSSAHPRRASVSAFGFGGSNFHIALEEYLGAAPRAQRLATQVCDLVLLGAPTADELLCQIDLMLERTASLARIASDSRAAWDAQKEMPYRLALVAVERADLFTALRAAHSRIHAQPQAAFDLPDGTCYGIDAVTGDLAMLFPGQGSQYVGMGAAVAMQFSSARLVWDHAADQNIAEHGNLQNVVFPRPAFDAQSIAAQSDILTRTEWAQPAIGAHSAALQAVLSELGINADCYAGHSFGEVSALHAGGVYDAQAAIKIAQIRGVLMQRAAAQSQPGAMTAVAGTVAQVQALLHSATPPLAAIQRTDAVVVANHNAPAQVVISGATDAIDAFETKLAREQIGFRRLPVAAAFHSNLVAKSSEAFADALTGIEFLAPKKPIFGNQTGAVFDQTAPAMRAQLAAQIAAPVQFVAMIEAMYSAGCRTFLEVGPGAVLTGLVSAILGARTHCAIALDRKGRDGVKTLLHGLAKLAAAGVGMQAKALFRDVRLPAETAVLRGLMVPISGANIGKPYPPQNAADYPAPNPPIPPIPTPLQILPAADAFTESGLESMSQKPTQSAAVSDAWLVAFQQSQAQTAAAHELFQRTMAESHAAYLRLSEAALVGLGGLRGDGFSVSDQPVPPSVIRSEPSIAVRPAPVAAHQPAPIRDPEHVLHTVPNRDSECAPPPTPNRHPGERRDISVVSASGDLSIPQSQASNPAMLSSLLLDIVAEKTGYPVEMLQLDMDLEGDLGIDSIKRVEILSAVDARAPNLPKLDRARLSALHTLAEIIAYLGGAGAPVATDLAVHPAPVAAHQPAPIRDLGVPQSQALTHPNLARYTLELIPAPAAGLAMPGLFGGAPVYVLGHDELAPLLAHRLSLHGVNAHGVATLPEGASACIFLGGLRTAEDENAAIGVNFAAFQLARKLAIKLSSGPGLFVTVQDTGGGFGLNLTADAEFSAHAHWASGMPALIKTCALEWPLASVKAIDIAQRNRTPLQIAQALCDELFAGGGELEIALDSGGARHTLHSIERAVQPGESRLGSKDVIVVSGGARGVTAICVIAWAKRCPASFVLLGRTMLEPEPACCEGMDNVGDLNKSLLADSLAQGNKLTPSALSARVQSVLSGREIRATLAAIRAAGASVQYAAVDVQDQGALLALFDKIRHTLGPITALVHGAGVLSDRRILEKTDAQFAHVFDTKVLGLRALLAATKNDPLKLLCVFSSVSARCGNTGQSDYAMANEVLAKVALHALHSRPGLRVKSLGWGPWEGGMVSPPLKARFAALGVPMLSLAFGAQMFCDEMMDASVDSVELVLGGAPRAEALLFDGAQARVDALEISIQRDTDSYLAGHAVKGVPVVPVVLAGEWFARAVRSFRPGLSAVALHDLVVLKGIRLEGFDTIGDRFRVEARAVKRSDSGATELALTLLDSKGRPRYSARAELHAAATDAIASGPVPVLALEPWHGGSPYPDSLFHRAQFALIERVHGLSDAGAKATILGVERANWPVQNWHFDVAALDAGMQLAVLYAQKVLGGNSLPTAIASMRQYPSIPCTGLITATVICRHVAHPSCSTDIFFENAKGERIAELLGVQNHAFVAG
jgi:acyl transferase domain-containing protein/acyl carrier protein